MSNLGTPINRKPGLTAQDRANTWVPVPGRANLEKNLEDPPKIRTKNYWSPGPTKVWPPQTYPPKQPDPADGFC